MTILSPDGLLAGAQSPVEYRKAITATMFVGCPQSLWPLAGVPAAGTYNSSLNGGVYSSSLNVPIGAIYHADPLTGLSYLAKFIAHLTVGNASTVWLCDRIWDNQPTINTTGAQTIASPQWPMRDQFGQSYGAGIQLGIEVGGTTSATAAALTSLTYTNSAGVAGQSAAFLDVPTAAAAQIGRFYRLQLAKGDQGVQSVQGVNFSTAWATGTIHLVAYRIIAQLLLSTTIQAGNAIDQINGGCPTIYNGSTGFLIIHPEATSAVNVSAYYQEFQG